MKIEGFFVYNINFNGLFYYNIEEELYRIYKKNNNNLCQIIKKIYQKKNI